MASISPEDDAQALLTTCLTGGPRPAGALERLMEPAGNRALFGTVVERLADLFEPHLCDVYADLFSEVIERTIPELKADALRERYQRVRKPRKFTGDPGKIERVYILSRVTLGADVAVTSILLDAAKHLFENATIYFAGPSKSWELFAADPMLEHVPLQYGRAGSLAERLAVWPNMRQLLSAPRSIVIDPDSRLTQLGLLPVCAEDDYYFFESRAYGGESDATLPALAKRWVAETFGVLDAKAYIAPVPSRGDPADVTVSLGVGENAAKRVADPFEADLLQLLVKNECSVLLDRGAGGEEAARAERAALWCGGSVRMWDGSFAGFASHIARSALYVGYDSAGGHVAAASGVPVISIFGGHASDRMMARWRPSGPGHVRVVLASDPATTLAGVSASLTAYNHGD